MPKTRAKRCRKSGRLLHSPPKANFPNNYPLTSKQWSTKAAQPSQLSNQSSRHQYLHRLACHSSAKACKRSRDSLRALHRSPTHSQTRLRAQVESKFTIKTNNLKLKFHANSPNSNNNSNPITSCKASCKSTTTQIHWIHHSCSSRNFNSNNSSLSSHSNCLTNYKHSHNIFNLASSQNLTHRADSIDQRWCLRFYRDASSDVQNDGCTPSFKVPH